MNEEPKKCECTPEGCKCGDECDCSNDAECACTVCK